MTTVTFHNPKTVVLDKSALYSWLQIADDRGSRVSIHFGEDQELAHAFALAVLRAVAKPETVISVLPEEGQ
jgi:hypothetical protein